MHGNVRPRLQTELQEIRAAGLWKDERSIESPQAAVLASAHVRDAQSLHNERRIAAAVVIGLVIFAPEQLSRAGIQARKDAADAECEDFSLGNRRCGPWPIAKGIPWPGLEGGGIRLGAPDFLAARQVETQHGLVLALPGEDINPSADHHG